jgi:hypothetical protein
LDPARTDDELLARLASAGDDEPVPILLTDLRTLTADDLPDGVAVQPCHKIEEKLQTLALDGVVMRGEDSPLVAWDGGVPLAQYVVPAARS